MNIEELQAEIDNAQSNELYIPLSILDAARLVANLNLEGLEALYLADPLIKRFMDRTGFVAFITPPGATPRDIAELIVAPDRLPQTLSELDTPQGATE